MSRGKGPGRARPPLRAAFGVVLAGVLPLPFFLVMTGWAPLAYLLELASLISVAVVAEGLGRISGLFLTLVMGQLLIYGAAIAAIAWWVERALRRRSDARAALVLGVGSALMIAIGLLVPLYVVPFGRADRVVDLAGVYRWPDPTLVAEPEVAPFPAPTVVSPREPCAAHDPLRRVLFGDTHVHTALSFDAMGQGTRNRPADAYRYARGEAVGLQPYDRDGNPSVWVQLSRPLDFAVVTDHAELLGETHICKVPGLPGHDGILCRLVRGWTQLGYMLVNGDVFSRWPPLRYAFCGEGGVDCLSAAQSAWAETQRAAEEAYDRSSDCAFTSFVGFEWSGMPGGYNTHRNVVFRSEIVPERPVNYIDTPTAEGLWDEIELRCRKAGTGCEALAIPHNSNVSSGRLFTVETSDGLPITAADARRRSSLEPLVEITQHKGDSECRRPGAPTADEYCAFETPPGSTMTEVMSQIGVREPEPLSFVREVLAEGVVQQDRIGANPFRLGLIGSTDTHFGTPGMVDERAFLGHAAGSVTRLVEAPLMPDLPQLNPGGLAAVWAEENTREAIFDAMARRETFGTSGPRIEVRFFGGFELADDLCEREDFVALGYAHGVPMGGDLPPARAGAAPSFAIRARADLVGASAPGADLERLQVVKLWSESGEAREAVFDVAVEGPEVSGLDVDTCTPARLGAAELCAVWRDPDFDPDVPAAWYVRVLEEPTCRWTQWVCVDQGVDCGSPASVPDELAHCCDPTLPRSNQERAWASPIWYAPGD